MIEKAQPEELDKQKHISNLKANIANAETNIEFIRREMSIREKVFELQKKYPGIAEGKATFEFETQAEMIAIKVAEWELTYEMKKKELLDTMEQWRERKQASENLLKELEGERK